MNLVADIREARGPNMIKRENTLRRFVVSINPTSRNLKSLVTQLQHEVAEKVTLHEGYFVSYEGEFVAQQEAARRIVLTMKTKIIEEPPP
jgi:Cu/Ag efflux pump CusA